MSTVKASWSQLPSQGQVISVCQNLPGDRLASSSVDGQATYVQVWEKDCATGDWDLVSMVTSPQAVHSLAWSHPEHGALLAGGTDTGKVLVWEAPRPAARGFGAADEEMDPGSKEWRQLAEVQCSKQPVRQVMFGPRQLGLILSAACKDGSVHVLEADRLLAPNSWTVQSTFTAALGSAGGECCGLSWRVFSSGVAPLVAIGLQGSVEVWQYVQAIMTWQRVSSLPTSSAGAQVVSLHWAPTLGRPCELVAAAHGTTVDVFSLAGDTSSMQAELVASLEHSASLQKVEFNMMGSCLAASTEGNLVHLWKPDFVGKWLLVSAIRGSPDAAEEP